ncbi:MAG: GH36 C-terminal domain-containing protein, partial [Coriobacteriales bacterium]|nr:GH36 C-terminal domain-containing protein [Coriobacteriales bacterium]
VLFSFLHSQEYGDACPPIRLKGLEGGRLYECKATGERVYGSTLMNYGIRQRLKGDFDSEMQYWVSVRG